MRKASSRVNNQSLNNDKSLLPPTGKKELCDLSKNMFVCLVHLHAKFHYVRTGIPTVQSRSFELVLRFRVWAHFRC